MNKNTLGYIVILVLLVVTSIFSLNLFLNQRAQKDVLDIRIFPLQIGDWNGKDYEITEKEYRILETRNLISREYVNPKGDRINLFIIYSETNRSVFHPPEVCLIGSGMNIADKKIEEIDYGKSKFSVNKMYVEKDKYRELVLYCYKVGNFYTHNFYLQQAYFALQQVFGRRVQGATIRVSMPIRENEEKTFTALKSFLKDNVKILESLF